MPKAQQGANQHTSPSGLDIIKTTGQGGWWNQLRRLARDAPDVLERVKAKSNIGGDQPGGMLHASNLAACSIQQTYPYVHCSQLQTAARSCTVCLSQQSAKAMPADTRADLPDLLNLTRLIRANDALGDLIVTAPDRLSTDGALLLAAIAAAMPLAVLELREHGLA
jgi:hypothetical protein